MEHPLDQFLYCPKCGSSHFEINNEKSKKLCRLRLCSIIFNPSAATVALILNEKMNCLSAGVLKSRQRELSTFPEDLSI